MCGKGGGGRMQQVTIHNITKRCMRRQDISNIPTEQQIGWLVMENLPLVSWNPSSQRYFSMSYSFDLVGGRGGGGGIITAFNNRMMFQQSSREGGW